MADQNLVVAGLLLVIVGLIIAAGAILLSFRGGRTKAKGGAVLIVGPFPIVFGTDKESARTLLILAILLVIILAVFYLLQPILLPL